MPDIKPRSTYHIGVDLMGSDMDPRALAEAVFRLSPDLPSSIDITLLATIDVFAGLHSPSPRVALQVVKEFISMEEAPLSAIRNKQHSSICVGITMLQERRLHALISAGNTGALMASATLSLPMLANINRPALLTLLPTRQNEVAVLDVGANASCKARHLIEFALIGTAFQKARGVNHPRVGLLNIGSEAKKGTPELREAYRLLAELNASQLNFSGNIEARDVFQGNIDVLVTDGFSGNVFLKTAEGIAGVILDELETIAQEECPSHLKEVLTEMRQRLRYAEYPGAILCGIDGLVIKCHSNASSQSLINTIISSIALLENQFIDKVKTVLEIF